MFKKVENCGQGFDHDVYSDNKQGNYQSSNPVIRITYISHTKKKKFSNELNSNSK